MTALADRIRGIVAPPGTKPRVLTEDAASNVAADRIPNVAQGFSPASNGKGQPSLLPRTTGDRCR